MSVEFSWNKGDLAALLQSCEYDSVLPFVQTYFKSNMKLLESGCGLGRWVRFLTDKGYDITGLELSQEAVDETLKHWPDLKMVQGDASHAPFNDGTFDGIISLGVVEHWPEGPHIPLADMYRILKPGGIAIISVPCLNNVRQIKHRYFWAELKALSRSPRKIVSMNRSNKNFRYVVFPAIGEFFEYRMTPQQYLEEIKKHKFEILDHKPLAEMDGIYHDLNLFGKLVTFQNWKFYPTKMAIRLNTLLKKRPFYHCHMQVVVVKKV